MTDPARVLLIDDNRDNLRVAVAHLEAAGIETRTARDGLTGIERARAGKVQLILLDIQMPEIDGYETCRRLKADPELAGIPVLFMTARTTVADKVRGFQAGAVDYITKPFEAPELLARVRTHLELRQLRHELAEQNASLEQRVAEHVEELRRLNAQLRAQIVDRSTALSRALSRLAATESLDEALLKSRLALHGRYRIEERVAGGGMGIVFRGLDEETGQRVAIKVIRPNAAAPLALLQRFLKEARVAAQIEHPAVVRMLHVDIDDDGQLYQVQEFVDGITLESCIQEGALSAHTPRILATLADALAAAHAQGVVHRDVKPANVLLTADEPGLKLVDFGISKQAAYTDTQPGRSQTTSVGVVLGTPEYMSPEQLHGTLEVGTPTDIYAFGVVAHRLYTGDYPGRVSTEGADPAAMALVQRCLSSEPSERPAAAELSRRFAKLAEGLSSLAAAVLEEGPGPSKVDDVPTVFPSDAG